MFSTKTYKAFNKKKKKWDKTRVAIPSGKFRTCPEFKIKFRVREEL